MNPAPNVFHIIGSGFRLSNSKRWFNCKIERNRKVNTKREREINGVEKEREIGIQK